MPEQCSPKTGPSKHNCLRLGLSKFSACGHLMSTLDQSVFKQILPNIPPQAGCHITSSSHSASIWLNKKCISFYFESFYFEIAEVYS